MRGAKRNLEGPQSERRKVRKGTQSCWTCRHRKVRCTFDTTDDATCTNCKRRGSKCISQEQPEGSTSIADTNNVQERLSRIEELLNRSSKSVATENAPKLPAEPPSQLGTSQTTSENYNRRSSYKHEDISRALIAEWPSEQEIDNICSLPVGLSVLIHSGICTPYSKVLANNSPSPQDMLKLPPAGSHPVLFARKLLILGTYLQGIIPSSLENLPDGGAFYHDVMSRVVDTAISLVTTNDSLICSVEGIDCIMIEAMYQNYAGNLHLSWMAVRRAVAVAQMMALHRGIKSPNLKFLEAATRIIFDPDQIAFRLVEMDRYLSLVLGLPCTSLESNFTSPKVLEDCLPIDRMQRMHCSLTDRIIQRDYSDLCETHEIDAQLGKIAAELTPQWWLLPDLSTSSSGGVKMLYETIHLMDQLSHYHLLIRLHLPYLLCPSTDHRYDRSKVILINVCRETLTRFIYFRATNPGHFYCRGTDFIAFVATTILCVAHVDSHSQKLKLKQQPSSEDAFDFLAHSRPTDRSMMERTLKVVEEIGNDVNNTNALRIGRVLRHLLAIEADVAEGIKCSTISSMAGGDQVECDGVLTDGGEGLQVHIPHFGTINFESRTVVKDSTIRLTVPRDARSMELTEHIPYSSQPEESSQRQPHGLNDLLDCLNTNYLVNEDTQMQLQAHKHIGRLSNPGRVPNKGHDGFGFNSNHTQVDEPEMPLIFPDEDDDWNLQGIDFALFDSMFGTVAFPDIMAGEKDQMR